MPDPFPRGAHQKAGIVSTVNDRHSGGSESSKSKGKIPFFFPPVPLVLYHSAVAKQLKLTDQDIKVLAWVLWHANGKGWATMSQETIARKLGVLRTSVTSSYGRLKAAGLIRLDKTKKTPKNQTGFVVVAVFWDHPEILPAMPDTDDEPAAFNVVGADDEVTTTVGDEGLSAEEDCRPSPTGTVVLARQSCVGLGRHKEEGDTKTKQDVIHSSPHRPAKGRVVGHEVKALAQGSGSKAKYPHLSEAEIAEGLASHKPAKVERTLKLIEQTTTDGFTDRTRREAQEFIIQAGPENYEVIAWACRKALVDDRTNIRDGGKAFRSRFQVMRKNARKAIEEGGIPSGNPPEKWYGEQDPPGSWEDAQLTPAKKWDLMNLFPECAGADAAQPWPDGYTVKAAGQVYDEEGQLYHHCRWDGSKGEPMPAPARDHPEPTPANSKLSLPSGRLIRGQKAEFRRLTRTAQRSGRPEDLLFCAKWLKGLLGGDLDLIADALASSWEHGPSQVEAAFRDTARALTMAGVCMHRVEGYSAPF